MYTRRLLPHCLRLVLALSLAVSPMLSAWHGGMAMAAQAPAMHGMEHARHMHAQGSHQDGGPQASAGGGCVQHGGCLGQCCPDCAHCAMTLLSPLVVASSPHPVLVPRVPLFYSVIVVALRERPPRPLAV